MPKTTRTRRPKRRAGRSTRIIKPFGRVVFNDDIRATIALSSSVDNYRFSIAQLFPSLASSLRSVRIRSIKLKFPAFAGLTTTSPMVQFYWYDPVNGQPTALTPEKPLSTTMPKTMWVNIPNYYTQFYPSSSTTAVFLITFNFSGTEKGTYLVPITTTAHLGYEPPPSITPTVAKKSKNAATSALSDSENYRLVSPTRRMRLDPYAEEDQ
jgi:hypothetical protein